MSLNRYAKKRDANELSIVQTLERLHISVDRIDQPCDLIIVQDGVVYLIEVKMPGKEKNLTDSEKEAKARIEAAGGRIHVCTTADQVFAVIGLT